MILISKIINKLIIQIILRNRRKRKIAVEGIPEGITFDTLNDLCIRAKGESLDKVTYVQISGWKTFGAFRLKLKTVKQNYCHLIYKNDNFRPDQNVAIVGLPKVPGSPEYWIYKKAKGTLAEYLPACYLCEEIIPGQYYRYILEDVGEEYHRITKHSETIFSVVEKIPEIHEAMNDWIDDVNRDDIFVYDSHYVETLDRYIWQNLKKYQRKYLFLTGDKTISTVCNLRKQISELRLRKEFFESSNFSPIHGDFNRANILMSKKNMNKVKLVDWEWAGLGLPHTDLASLLQGVSPRLEQQALDIYSKANQQLPFDVHNRLFQWCKMERGLINASYIMALNMESPIKKRLLPGHIKNALRNIIKGYESLV